MVIGGGGGVGGGVALALAASGANVVVGDIDPESAAAVANEIEEAGGSARALGVDSTSVDSLGELYDHAVSEFGAVHIMSNQCGVIMDESVLAASDEDWAWHWEFNVMTMIRSARTVVPYLEVHGDEAHIVTTASIAGLLALPPQFTGGVNTGLYTATKHAVVGYTDMLRAELAPKGIGVTVVCPGLVEGNLAGTSARNRPHEYGGSGPQVKGSRPMPEGAMTRLDAGTAIVEAIVANRAYCFTHPEAVALLTDRYEHRLADGAAAQTDREQR